MNKLKLNEWFFEPVVDSKNTSHQKSHWLNVMCLTGVDYFSSLGFAPAMAFLYAGLLSPFATAFLVLLNLFGALPMYSKVAEKSPNGQGSISMLQNLLPKWWGKILVISLLGFAATDFIMTITLCASDAAKHMVENAYAPWWLKNQLVNTLFLVALLGAIFVKGFKEAILIAVFLVWTYLILTLTVILASFWNIYQNPELTATYLSHLTNQHPSVWQIAFVSMLTFPRLALGMSGFETGVAVMPQIRAENSDTQENPESRIKRAKYLLLTAAVIMSFFLLASSYVTTIQIPEAAFAPEGKANGRALAYLAHGLLGNDFGTIYDISTCLVLWFAGASAMAGLLSLIPRYLPGYGMAPEWTASLRPLVILLTTFAIAIVIYFKADVDAQAGAFATGLLVLMSSAAFACTLSVWNESLKQRWRYILITVVFVYTTIDNIIGRPEGLHIASVFIAFILVSSFISRCIRSTELRVGHVELDQTAQSFLNHLMSHHHGEIRLLAHRPGSRDYRKKEAEAREFHSIQPPEGDFIFLEVRTSDTSEFNTTNLIVKGELFEGYRIWKCESPSIPNAIAGILLHIRDTTQKVPHVYFGWTEGHPVLYVIKYILWGEGETAPITREILRSKEPNQKKRPRVHVS